MSSGTLPQLNIIDFEPQIIWLLIVFSLFYYAIKTYITPYFFAETENRDNYILKNHRDAKQLQKKAERLADDYHEKMQAVYIKANHLILEAKQKLNNDLEVEKQKINSNLSSRFDEHCKSVEQQISQVDKDFLLHIDVLKNQAQAKIFINKKISLGAS